MIFEEIFEASPHIFISKNHPLAKQPFVTQEELRQEMLILLSLGSTELTGKRADRIRKTLGGDAQHLKLVETTETINMFVNSGIGYTLLNGDLEYTYGYEQLAFLTIKGSTERHYTSLISRKDNKKLILQRFLEYTDEIIE